MARVESGAVTGRLVEGNAGHVRLDGQPAFAHIAVNKTLEVVGLGEILPAVGQCKDGDPLPARCERIREVAAAKTQQPTPHMEPACLHARLLAHGRQPLLQRGLGPGEIASVVQRNRQLAVQVGPARSREDRRPFYQLQCPREPGDRIIGVADGSLHPGPPFDSLHLPAEELVRARAALLFGLIERLGREAPEPNQSPTIPTQREGIGPRLGGPAGCSQSITQRCEAVGAAVEVVRQQIEDLDLAACVDPFQCAAQAEMGPRPHVGSQCLIRHFAEQRMREAAARLTPAMVEKLPVLQLDQALVQRRVVAGLSQSCGQHLDVYPIAGDRSHRQHAMRGFRQGIDASQDEALHRAGQRRQAPDSRTVSASSRRKNGFPPARTRIALAWSAGTTSGASNAANRAALSSSESASSRSQR